MKIKKTIITALIATLSLSSLALAAPKPHTMPAPHKIQQHKQEKHILAHKKAHHKKFAQVAHHKYQWHHGHKIPLHCRG